MKSVTKIYVNKVNVIIHFSLPNDSTLIKFDFVDDKPKIWYVTNGSLEFKKVYVYVTSDNIIMPNNYECEYIGSAKDVREKMWHAFEMFDCEPIHGMQLYEIKL